MDAIKAKLGNAEDALEDFIEEEHEDFKRFERANRERLLEEFAGDASSSAGPQRSQQDTAGQGAHPKPKPKKKSNRERNEAKKANRRA